jgi:uncharacterized membrane protein
MFFLLINLFVIIEKMFKGLKFVLVIFLLSFFINKSEASTHFNLKTISIEKKEAKLSTNNSLRNLGISNEINFQFSNPYSSNNTNIVVKKLAIKFLSNSKRNIEQLFAIKVQLNWIYCKLKTIFFSNIQIIFPFHYFW